MPTLSMNGFESGDRAALASGEVVHEIQNITPTIAANLLELNVKNRPLSPHTVAKYQRDMLSGRWDFAGDPLRFDTHGNLSDGQHRLTALAFIDDDSVQFPFLIVRGLPPETQMVMDQGRKRNAGQQLSIKGVKNASNVAAGVKVYLLWESGYLFRDSKAASLAVSTPQIEQWVEDNVDLVAHVNAHCTAIRNNFAPPSVGFAAAIAFAKVAPETEAQFFQDLADGGMPVGHPINTLDKRLQRVRREGFKMSQRDYLALFIQAWNATIDGKKMTKFQRPVGGRWAEDNFPKVGGAK